MAEETTVTAPVETAPAVTPSVPAVETPAVDAPATETPVIETTAPEVVAKPAEATLLTGDKIVPEVKADEPLPVDGDAKPAEQKDGDTDSAPVFEAFTVPEGVTFDNEKMGEFTKQLAEFETTTKASHEEVQKLGQSLIDRHVQEVQSAQDRLLQKLIEDGNAERETWKDSFLKSPEFANRTDTVLNSAIDAIGIYGGTPIQQQEFRELMASTGVGNHPAMIRMLSNIMIAKPEPKQLAAPTIAKAVPKSQMQKRYGSKS